MSDDIKPIIENEIKDQQENNETNENVEEIIPITMKKDDEKKLTIFQKGKQTMIHILIVIKEKIQQSIDISFHIISIPIEMIKKLYQRPLVKKITNGVTCVALVGVCVYSLGYIPYQHITQSKTLKFH